MVAKKPGITVVILPTPELSRVCVLLIEAVLRSLLGIVVIIVATEIYKRQRSAYCLQPTAHCADLFAIYQTKDSE